MSAIITEKFRKNNVDAFLNDIVTEDCYVGIGRSSAWPIIDGDIEDDAGYNVEAPLGTFGDVEDIKNNLITLIGIGGSGATSRVIPRIEAKSSRRYKAYNPFSIDCFYQSVIEGVLFFPCYASVGNNVYLCLKGSSAVGSIPTGSETTRTPFVINDAIWVFIYTYENTASTPINATQFLSVPSTATPATATTATSNMVFGFTVIDGGSGFTTVPTVTYVTDSGPDVTLVATIDDGKITSVSYDPIVLPASFSTQKGYVQIVGGGGVNARVYPNQGPANGFGANPAEDLPSWYAGITVQIEENLNDAVFIPYRQVSLIRNPEAEVGVADSTVSLSGLNRLEFAELDTLGNITIGDRVTQVSSNAIGIADWYDSTNRYLYYHQTQETGFVPFVISNEIEVSGEAATPTAVTPSEYVTGTGDVLFVENRRKITRTGGQTEDITIILQF